VIVHNSSAAIQYVDGYSSALQKARCTIQLNITAAATLVVLSAHKCVYTADTAAVVYRDSVLSSSMSNHYTRA
jgi:aromatic ring-opening dioxygenase LigB subunit